MMAGVPLGQRRADGASPDVRAITPSARGSRDERLTAALRLVIVVIGLVVSMIDPDEDPARRPYAFAVLGLFAAYAAITAWQVLRQRTRISTHAAPWVDFGWTTMLIAVSEGTSSIFYPLYMFAILCAAFQGGFRAAVPLLLASATSFAVVGGLTAPEGAKFELDRTLIRSAYLLIMGYLIAYWGEHEVNQRARLELLRDVATLSNPRFGIDRTLGRVLGRLRLFFGADTCRLVVRNPATGEAWMRVATATNPDASDALQLPPEVAGVLDVGAPGPILHRARGCPIVGERDARFREPSEASSRLATELEAESFLSVPFRYGVDAVARIYVTSQHARKFDASDLDFLGHVLDQVVPMLENVRLVDSLASEASEEERRRIGRDLHDSVIQPYIGLRMGLAAARQSVASGDRDEATRLLDRLASLAEDEIETLRGYIHGLKDGRRMERADVLADSVRRFCDRFKSATGIDVTVVAQDLAPLNDRLAAEAFQMVAEALSNVRRHTDSRSVRVHLSSTAGHLVVHVENDGATVEEPPAFSPRSLQERAASLGGTVAIQAGGTMTAVHIEIPL